MHDDIRPTSDTPEGNTVQIDATLTKYGVWNGVIYRPAPPVNSEGGCRGRTEPRYLRNYHRVTLGGDTLAAYDPVYFESLDEIVADFLDLVRTPPFADRVFPAQEVTIWSRGVSSDKDGCRLLAVIQLNWYLLDPSPETPLVVPVKATGKTQQFENGDVELFCYRAINGWPSREQWIAAGRGPLDYLDPKDYPERDHAAMF